jgi:hypothetical protein
MILEFLCVLLGVLIGWWASLTIHILVYHRKEIEHRIWSEK